MNKEQAVIRISNNRSKQPNRRILTQIGKTVLDSMSFPISLWDKMTIISTKYL